GDAPQDDGDQLLQVGSVGKGGEDGRHGGGIIVVGPQPGGLLEAAPPVDGQVDIGPRLGGAFQLVLQGKSHAEVCPGGHPAPQPVGKLGGDRHGSHTGG